MSVEVAVSWDHPRVCGEHEDGKDEPTLYTGSSPRVRGALPAVAHHHPSRGIIPACAGSTEDLAHQGLQVWDHPRVCGEH